MSLESRRSIFVFSILALLFFYGLAKSGMLGPDEPRYAAIGREMARTGDWTTPVLWGSPWFEKPPLLFWTTAAATKLGLDPDRAPRLPVAAISFAFLLFFYWFVRREFGAGEAFYATAILATSAGWIAYSLVAVTDIPLSATFCSALLISIRLSRGNGGTRTAAIAGALLGLAVLAKGLVPLVLFVPALIPLRRRWRLLLVIAASCLLVAAPWYAAVTVRHGRAFIDEFIWKHHFSRFNTDALQHVQPFWFYLPVLLAGLFPWTPLLALFRSRMFTDERLRFLALWTLYALIFFSTSKNKLPGYVLPLLPPLALMSAVALASARRTRVPLTLAALLIGVIPIAAAILPQALAIGLTRSDLPGLQWPWLVAALIAAGLCLRFQHQDRRSDALLLVAAALGITLLAVKLRTMPILDRTVSARSFYNRYRLRFDGVCLDGVGRDLTYGLQYYAGRTLPVCSGDRQKPRILGVADRLIFVD